MSAELDTIKEISSITMTGGGSLSDIRTSDTYAEIVKQAKALQSKSRTSAYLHTSDFSETSTADQSSLMRGGAVDSDFRISTIPTEEFSMTSSFDPTSSTMASIEYGQSGGGKTKKKTKKTKKSVLSSEEDSFGDLDFSDLSSSFLYGGDGDDSEEDGEGSKTEEGWKPKKNEGEEEEEDTEDGGDEESESDTESQSGGGRSFITGSRRLPGASVSRDNEEPAYLLSDSEMSSSFGSEWDSSSEYSTLLKS